MKKWKEGGTKERKEERKRKKERRHKGRKEGRYTHTVWVSWRRAMLLQWSGGRVCSRRC